MFRWQAVLYFSELNTAVRTNHGLVIYFLPAILAKHSRIFSSVLYDYYIPIIMGSQVFFPALWENINYGRIWRTAAFNAAGKKFRSD